MFPNCNDVTAVHSAVIIRHFVKVRESNMTDLHAGYRIYIYVCKMYKAVQALKCKLVIRV